MDINLQAIEAALVKELADRAEREFDVGEFLRDALDRRLNRLFAERAEAEIEATVSAIIKDGFDREFRPVDAFGHPSGPSTTLRKALAGMISNFWQQKVDKSGKPGDGWGYDMTRAEYTMAQLVTSDFRGELQQHVVNVAGGLKDGLRAELRNTVNGLLDQVFRVRTQNDKPELL